MILIENSLHIKKRIFNRKCMMPPIFSMGIMLLLICFTVTARGVIHTNYEQTNITAATEDNPALAAKGLNQAEVKILDTLWRTAGMNAQTGHDRTFFGSYYSILKNYLSNETVNIKEDSTGNILKQLADLQDIINYEGKTDMKDMSLDSKKMAFYITEQVYKACGLTLEINQEDNIGKVSDAYGKVLYKYDLVAQKPVFQVNALVITLTAAAALLGICIMIAKKNQLFGKEVVYDGFDEKGFAE